jgi:two-component system nitrate/nitrite response regulator NarL
VKITVVIAHDHRLIRDSLRAVLSKDQNIQILGEATNGFETLDIIGDLEPDVVLLDFNISELDVVELIQSIINKSPKTKVLKLMFSTDETLIFQALKAGAKGYISKNASLSDLKKAIQTVYKGELWIERKMISSFFDQENEIVVEDQNCTIEAGLTKREREVLLCLSSGSTNKQIANTLCISEKTVKCHLNSIFKKLNVSRRLEAILYAINRGLT